MEHGAGRAPSQPHAVQGKWLPQVSGCGCPSWGAPPSGSQVLQWLCWEGTFGVGVVFKQTLLFRFSR